MNCPLPFTTVPQPEPHGPVHALMVGLEMLVRSMKYDSGEDEVIVIAADTYLSEPGSLAVAAAEGLFIGMAHTHDMVRSWTWHEPEQLLWTDSPIPYPEDVFIGVFMSRLQWLCSTVEATLAQEGVDATMGPFLRFLDFQTARHRFTDWHDVGDLPALAAARRATFTSRDKHKLSLNDRGVVTKIGASMGESIKAKEMSDLVLGPRWLGYDEDIERLQLEYCDLPSLAELFLYWPGRPDTWQHVLSVVMARLERDLWTGINVERRQALKAAQDMYIDKPRRRLIAHGGYPVPEPLIDYIAQEVVHEVHPSRIHGDLNFGNILYSLGTDVFRLIDPRGDWGGFKRWGDLRYEYAKLRFSYRGLTAITHDLDVSRAAEARAMDELLEDRGVNLKHIAAIEATMYLSSIPLHDKSEREPMYQAALRCTEEAIS